MVHAVKNGIYVPYIGSYCKLALQSLLFSQWKETCTSKGSECLRRQDTWEFLDEETWEQTLQWLEALEKAQILT